MGRALCGYGGFVSALDRPYEPRLKRVMSENAPGGPRMHFRTKNENAFAGTILVPNALPHSLEGGPNVWAGAYNNESPIRLVY